MYQKSYQAQRIRDNLLPRAFGDRAGADEARLFALLRNASLKRDEFAPIDPTPAELQCFEQRRDIRLLRARYAETTEKKAREDLRAQLSYLMQILSRLLIQQKRQEYFAEVDRLRALGLPTEPLRAEKSEPPSGTVAGGAVAIGRFLDSAQCDGQMELCATLFVSYLRRRPAEVVILAGQAPDPASHDVYDHKRSRCLLGCGSFFGRYGLTRHMERFHLDTGTFDCPFPCPECLVNSSAQENLIHGPSDWCSHVATKHRKIDAPDLPSRASTPRRPRDVCGKQAKTLACPLCGRMFPTEDGLRRHVTVLHLKKGDFNNGVFPCPECRRIGAEPAEINSYESFTDHCAKIHGTSIRTTYRVSASAKPGKLKREAGDANKEHQGLAGEREMPTKRRRRTVGDSVLNGGTRDDTGLESAGALHSSPDLGKLPRSEPAAVSQSEAAPDSPSLPLQPPNTSVLPSEVASGVGRTDPSPDPHAFWSNLDLDLDLTMNPWVDIASCQES